MKKITDSLLKRIVRRSLNESYGLLNEYNITTKTQIGDIPIGTTINNMTLPECPDGGFCYSTLDQARKDYEELSVGGSGGLIQKYCPSKNLTNRKGAIAMGKPTMSIAQINSASGELWSELTDTGMDPADIKNGFRSLENFPNFCKSEELFYSYWESLRKNMAGRGQGAYNGFEGNSNYGIINDDNDDRDSYFLIISELFQASIQVSDSQYEAWFTQLNANYKVTKDAADKLDKDNLDKKNREAKIKGGGGEYVKWLQEHPALINKSEIITTDRGDANLYSLNTNDPIINQYQYGVLLVVDPNNPSLDGTYDDVRVKKGTDIAVSINPATDKFWQFAISQNDVWRYDDVAWSDAFNPSFGGKLALTTSPDLEDDGKLNKSIQTERTKGFRHNLLTEVEYKLGDTNELKPGILKIQQKLGITPKKPVVYDKETVDKVKELQAKQNPPIPVNGIVDDVTLTAIMALPSATEYTRLLTIGSTGPDVEAIQTKLKAKKGKYGTDTQTAVMNYQKKYTDLPDSGDVDEETFNHIMANTKLGTDIPISYSGKKHNYKKGDWISVKPNSGSDATQLYENNGYFRILDVPDDYTIIIDVDWTKGVKSYSLAGGTTAKVIFGPDAIGGVKTIPTVIDNSTKGSRNKVYNSGTRSKGSTSTGNVETKTRKVARNTEFCNNLIQIKQYLNTNKGSDLTVNCQKTQKTLNQIMLALTGGAQIKPVATVTPVDQPQYNVVQPESPTNQFL